MHDGDRFFVASHRIVNLHNWQLSEIIKTRNTVVESLSLNVKHTVPIYLSYTVKQIQYSLQSRCSKELQWNWRRGRTNVHMITVVCRLMCLTTLKVATDYHEVIIYLIADILLWRNSRFLLCISKKFWEIWRCTWVAGEISHDSTIVYKSFKNTLKHLHFLSNTLDDIVVIYLLIIAQNRSLHCKEMCPVYK